MKTRPLTPEDRAEVERLYVTSQPREVILAWLREHGYGHTWGGIKEAASCNGWKGRRKGIERKPQPLRNLGPFFAESVIGTP